MPSGELVGTTLKFTGREVTDGHSHFSNIAKHDDGFLPITKQRYETPAPENLFTVNEDCENLPKEMAADFHTIVAKMLYVTKRARPDTCLSVVFLTTM